MRRDTCPYCEHDPGEASWALAPGQAICVNRACPIVSWRMNR